MQCKSQHNGGIYVKISLLSLWRQWPIRNSICGKPTLNQFTSSLKDESGDILFLIVNKPHEKTYCEINELY